MKHTQRKTTPFKVFRMLCDTSDFINLKLGAKNAYIKHRNASNRGNISHRYNMIDILLRLSFQFWKDINSRSLILAFANIWN